MPGIFKIKDGRSVFWQWDLDRQLLVGVDGCGEVHFCNGTSDCSLICEVYEQDGAQVVDVPNAILQTACPFTVYAYVKNTAGGYTKRAVMFSVRPRTKPADYVYTETEVKSWDSLDERIKALEQGGTGAGVTDEHITEVVEHYLAENPVEIPEALPNPHALHLTGAVEATYDGSEAVEVVIPQGGGEKPWRLLDTIDFSKAENQTHWLEWTDLGDVTDILMFINGAQNATSTASGYGLNINDVDIGSIFAPNQKDGTMQYWWARAAYDGLVWHPSRSHGAIASTNVTMVNNCAYIPYNLVKNVGTAKKIALQVPNPNYKNTAGTWEIWVR